MYDGLDHGILYMTIVTKYNHTYICVCLHALHRNVKHTVNIDHGMLYMTIVTKYNHTYTCVYTYVYVYIHYIDMYNATRIY